MSLGDLIPANPQADSRVPLGYTLDDPFFQDTMRGISSLKRSLD